jgi:ferrous iron transport protein B
MHKAPLNIALVGNPNCGKTTVFNALTGSRQRVGNWPGVTVEKKTGRFQVHHDAVIVTDLPGTYSLEREDQGGSEDERIAREFAVHQKSDLIVNIVDASNLHRNLFLTGQLLDLGRPMLVVLNMIDEVHARGETIDLDTLRTALGCPVVAISASRGHGMAALKQEIVRAARAATKPMPQVTLGIDLLARLEELLQSAGSASELAQLSRWNLLETLQDSRHEPAALSSEERTLLAQLRNQLALPFDGELDIAIASARYEAITQVCQQAIARPREAGISLTERLDRLALHRFWGVPLFFAVMYLMFLLSINVGSCFIDFFDILSNTILVKGGAHLLGSLGAPTWLIVILAQGVGGGIQTVSTFIPVIAAMFLCLSFLEDSGYLARAAMVMDRVMRVIGLPGKAFVPMLVGFGCNVPAIMGTRTLDNTRDRLLSITMIPYMSCGARLPVYALFAAAFFPHNGQNVVFTLYLTGIAVAAVTGLILKHTLLPGEASPFVMELPPYRLPTLRGLLTRAWDRLQGFIVRAGKAIVIVVAILNLLNTLGVDGSFGNENTDHSLLATISRQITPVFEPMGVQEDNWPATVGIFTGVFAKEAVVGTLDALYTSMARNNSKGEPEEPFSLSAGVAKAIASVPEKLAELGGALTDPLGLNVGDVDNEQLAAKEREVHTSTFGQMRLLFGTAAAGMAYLLFVLLYLPCVAAMGAVYRETNLRWTLLVAAWSFSMAWGGGTLYYQSTRLASGHAPSALGWLIGIPLVAALLVLMLRIYGSKPGRVLAVSGSPATACAKDGGCGCC